MKTQSFPITKQGHGIFNCQEDSIAVEQPLAIKITSPAAQEYPLAITLRSPGDDYFLALGYLIAEGIIESRDDIIAYSQLKASCSGKAATINLTMKSEQLFLKAQQERRHLVSSACGACSKTNVDSLFITPKLPVLQNLRISISQIREFSAMMPREQKAFLQTGGVHGAGFFENGRLTALYEDIGRHNAVDKTLGYCAAMGHSTDSGLLFLSGRAGFELVQKAAMSRVQMIIAVGSPSSLAINMAKQYGITLIGFVKKSSFNIYTYPERVSQQG